jgi:hypothetical protein
LLFSLSIRQEGRVDVRILGQPRLFGANFLSSAVLLRESSPSSSTRLPSWPLSSPSSSSAKESLDFSFLLPFLTLPASALYDQRILAEVAADEFTTASPLSALRVVSAVPRGPPWSSESRTE